MDIKDIIKSLESKKEEWAKKNEEMVLHTHSYVYSNDPQYIKEFYDKLKKIGDELTNIGKEYHEQVSEAAHTIAEGYEDNPIVQELIKEVKSDIVFTGSISSGTREKRLELLDDFIKILKNWPNN